MARPQSDRVSVRFIASRRVTPWRVSFREWDEKTKKRERREPSFATEEEARTFAADKERELQRVTEYLRKMKPAAAPPVIAAGMTLREWVEQKFLRDIAPRRKGGTFASYETVLRLHVLPVIGDVVLSAQTFTADHVIAVVSRAADNGAAWGQQRNILKVLSATLKWTAPPYANLLPTNPCTGLSDALRDSNWREPKPNPLTWDEQAAFLTWLQTGTVPDDYVPLAPSGDRPVEAPRPLDRRELHNVIGGHAAYYPYFLLLIQTGMRRNEATALRWDQHVFLEVPQPYVLVARTFSPTTRRLNREGKKQYAADGMVAPKTNRERKVWLSPELTDVLRELARTRRERGKWGEPSPFVFTSPASGIVLQVNTVDRVFRAGLRAIGAAHAGHTVHDLRDTFATLQLERGTPLAWVADMLGHAKRSTTLDRYTGWIPQPKGDDYVGRLSRPAAPAPAEAVVGRSVPASTRSRRRGESPALRVVSKPRRTK